MADYRLTDDPNIVIRTADGAHIPNNPANADRIAYEVWLAAGGVPDPLPPKIDPYMKMGTGRTASEILRA